LQRPITNEFGLFEQGFLLGEGDGDSLHLLSIRQSLRLNLHFFLNGHSFRQFKVFVILGIVTGEMFGVEFRRYLSISSPYIQFLESLGNELGAEECSVFVDEDVPMIPLIHLGNLGFKILPHQSHDIFLALYLKFIGRLVSRQFRI